MVEVTAERWPLVGRGVELERLRQLVASAARGGVVIAGPAGVGKSRLAAECLELSARAGLAPVKALATASAAAIPLGALSPLLPPLEGEATSVELLRRARAAIVERGRGRRVALLVDDAHQLDAMSATLVAQLAALGDAFVIATARSEAQAPDAIVSLWKDGIAERIDLCPLGVQHVGELLRTVWGGDAAGDTVGEFADVSGGNPLFLRELVIAACDAGLLRKEEGLWRLSGPLPVSSRLVEIVTTRLGTMDDRERQALEVVAHGEPLGVAPLEREFGADVLASLERRGLVSIVRDGVRMEVRLAHPLYGEVVRARLPETRRRQVNRALREVLTASGARRRDDVLRIGAAQVVAGGPFDPAVLLAAAHTARARSDLALAERLAEAAVAAGAGFEADLLLARLHFLQGRSEEAERELAALAGRAVTDAQRVELAETQIDTLVLGLGRHTDALRVAATAEAAVVDVDWRDLVSAKRAELLFLSGDTGAALDVLAPILDRAPARTVARVASTAGLCLMLQGRLAEAIDVADRGRDVYDTLDGVPLPFGSYLVAVVKGVALGHAGRLREAQALAEEGYAGAVARRSLEAQGIFAELLSWLATLQGRPATGQHYAAEATGVYRQLGWIAFLRFALANLAHALALLGSATEACRVLDELDALDIPSTHVSGSLISQARAWAAVAAGDADAAREVLDQAAKVAAATGERVGEAAVLHDLARLGMADAVVERLTELAGHVEGELVRARAAHADALASGDGIALEEVATRFQSRGAALFAAEALASAAVAFRRAGDRKRAAAAERRMAAVVRDCEGATTPALAALGARAVLTPQELKVAGLAAAGFANKEIATRVGVSVRTVETQLQRVYDKLGVHRRSDLPGALSL